MLPQFAESQFFAPTRLRVGPRLKPLVDDWALTAREEFEMSSTEGGELASAKQRSRVRLVELDLLRFAAAMSVVLFHYQPRLREGFGFLESGWIALPARFGYLGVDLFFLISGYVIVMSASGRNARSFLVHRVIRLYPSYWAALAMTIVAVLFLAPPQEHPSGFNVMANASMLPSYLGQMRIDDVYWTLAVEWKFYALVALAVSIGLAKHIETTALVWIAALAIQSMGLESAVLSSLTIYPYGSYFASGVIVYCIREHGVTLTRFGALAAGWLVSLATAKRAMPNFVRDIGPSDSGVVFTIVTVFFALLLWISISDRQLRPMRVWRMLGAVTFPLYLVHSRLGQLLIKEWHPFTLPAASLACSLLIVAGISMLMAWFIELQLVPRLGRSPLVRRAAGDSARNG